MGDQLARAYAGNMQFQRFALNNVQSSFRRTALIAALILGCQGQQGDAGVDENSNGGDQNGGARGGSVGTPRGGADAQGSAGDGGDNNGGVGGENMVGGNAGMAQNAGGAENVGGQPISEGNTADCDAPGLKLTRIATAQSPMALTGAPGDDRIFVVERAGLIRILRDGRLQSSPFLDVRSSVITVPITGGSERGLLNIALHPRFPEDPRFYVFYTRRGSDPHSNGNEGAIVIAEGRQSAGDPDKAEGDLKALIVVPHRDDHHVGGMLDFGPDGMLYAGTGDGGGMDDERVGQDPRRTLAKILRIDVDNPDSKPAGNLSEAGADKHTWAYGARNPYRGAFDRKTGDLYFGDVGWSSWEEINFVPPGMKDINFGWGYDPSLREGSRHYQAGMEGTHPMPAFTAFEWEPFGYLPIHEYPHDGPGWRVIPESYMRQGFTCDGGTDNACSAAVIGGQVYRGPDATLDGRYFYGDHVRNFIKSFIVEDGKATCHADHTSDLVTNQTRVQGLNGFGLDGMGRLYLHDLAAGNIYRVERE